MILKATCTFAQQNSTGQQIFAENMTGQLHCADLIFLFPAQQRFPDIFSVTMVNGGLFPVFSMSLRCVQRSTSDACALPVAKNGKGDLVNQTS